MEKNWIWYIMILFILSIISFKTLENSNYNSYPIEAGVNDNKNYVIAKLVISRSIYRSISFFNKDISFNELHSRLWNLEHNPKFPESGWGNIKHKTVYPISGANSEIVPLGSIGFLINSESMPKCFNQIGDCDIFSQAFGIYAKEGEKYRITVYCYISEEFDGISAKIAVGWSAIKNKLVKRYIEKKYDLNKKTTWQKLEFEFECVNKGTIPINIIASKYKKNLGDELKGYAIFAHPTLEKIHPFCKNPDTEDDLSMNSSALQYRAGFNSLLSGFYEMTQKTKSINNIFKYDTTYYPFIADLETNFSGINLTEGRLQRWRFAVDIFMKEYKTTQKIFGGGFNFLNWYGYVFKKDKTATDYPHNPFLHILLYSGVFGVTLYILLLYKVFYLYWKFRKEYPLFFIFFIITYYFTFFSGGNPFTPPVTGFFMMLPFLIHMVHKRELEN
jgi:hypothetical protein